MSSSFDAGQQVSHEDNVYGEVMALYAAIKDTPGAIRVRRAEMRQGEVQAEPLDFIIDVELKAKRVLTEHGVWAAWIEVLNAPENFAMLQWPLREALGKAFEASRLGVDGDYKKLYFRVKNHSQNFQEDSSGIFE